MELQQRLRVAISVEVALGHLHARGHSKSMLDRFTPSRTSTANFAANPRACARVRGASVYVRARFQSRGDGGGSGASECP